MQVDLFVFDAPPYGSTNTFSRQLTGQVVKSSSFEGPAAWLKSRNIPYTGMAELQKLREAVRRIAWPSSELTQLTTPT